MKNLKQRVQRLKNLNEPTQRLENLERRMQQFKQFIEDVQERVAANKKPLDNVEEEAEAKAAGNGLKFEGIMKEFTAYKERLDTVVVLVSDLVHDQPSTKEKLKEELFLTRRNLRPRKK